jgi:hypothetical protein
MGLVLTASSWFISAMPRTDTGSKIEMWTLAHQLQRIAQGKTLHIISEKGAMIHWSFDGWKTGNESLRTMNFSSSEMMKTVNKHRMNLLIPLCRQEIEDGGPARI